MYLSSHDMLTPSIDNSLLNIESIFLQNMRESAKKKKKKKCSFWHPKTMRSCRYRDSSGRNATLSTAFWLAYGFLQFLTFLALFAVNREVYQSMCPTSSVCPNSPPAPVKEGENRGKKSLEHLHMNWRFLHITGGQLRHQKETKKD